MSWLESSGATARDLARLLTRGGVVPPQDLDAALTARSAVLDLVSRVHTDTTGRNSWYYLPRIESLDADPVHLMGQMVNFHPRTAASTALSDVLAQPAQDGAGLAWRQVARHATLAHHDWAGAEASTRPTGDGAWTVISRLAHLAGATAALDADLATSAAAAGRPLDAQVLTGAAWSGLGRVAASVAQLAARGNLPDVPDVTAPPSRRLVAVRSLADVPAATDRLAHLVTTSASLSPRDVQDVLRAHARVADTAARALAAVLPHPGPAERLRLVRALGEHAERLSHAATRPARAATLRTSDPRPLAQAAEITHFLAGSSARATPGADAAALVGYAHAAAGVTRALEDTARRQLDEGRWLVPPGEDSTSELLWVPPSARTAEPALLTGLTHAGRHAPVLAAAAAAAAPAPAPNAAAIALQAGSGSTQLAAALAAHRATQGRPATPRAAAGPTPPSHSGTGPGTAPPDPAHCEPLRRHLLAVGPRQIHGGFHERSISPRLDLAVGTLGHGQGMQIRRHGSTFGAQARRMPQLHRRHAETGAAEYQLDVRQPLFRPGRHRSWPGGRRRCGRPGGVQGAHEPGHLPSRTAPALRAPAVPAVPALAVPDPPPAAGRPEPEKPPRNLYDGVDRVGERALD